VRLVFCSAQERRRVAHRKKRRVGKRIGGGGVVWVGWVKKEAGCGGVGVFVNKSKWYGVGWKGVGCGFEKRVGVCGGERSRKRYKSRAGQIKERNEKDDVVESLAVRATCLAVWGRAGMRVVRATLQRAALLGDG
jgi:hypothetical protein